VSHDDAQERSAQEHGLGLSQSMYVPLDLPIDFEAFYLAHQEAFHAYAEVHFGARLPGRGGGRGAEGGGLLVGGGVGDDEELVAGQVHHDLGVGALGALRGGVLLRRP
jgi:hypothetical protein